MLKPLISYYGGKQRLAPYVVPLIRQIPHSVYTEPFAGGAAILYAKGRPETKDSSSYREAINDISELIINLYRVARAHPDELQRRIELTLYSQSEYRRAIEYCKAGHEDPIELAWATYVNAQMSFANKMNGGWGMGLNSRNSASTWVQKQSRLPECLERLKDVHIGCEDALRFIKRWDSPQSLHY